MSHLMTNLGKLQEMGFAPSPDPCISPEDNSKLAYRMFCLTS